MLIFKFVFNNTDSTTVGRRRTENAFPPANFSYPWPWTLTYDLDRWIWPTLSRAHHRTKYLSQGSFRSQLSCKHTHTQRAYCTTLTTEVIGENNFTNNFYFTSGTLISHFSCFQSWKSIPNSDLQFSLIKISNFTSTKRKYHDTACRTTAENC